MRGFGVAVVGVSQVFGREEFSRGGESGQSVSDVVPDAMAAWSMGDFERCVELCGVEGSSRSPDHDRLIALRTRAPLALLRSSDVARRWLANA
jgi:hypothetical protein